MTSSTKQTPLAAIGQRLSLAWLLWLLPVAWMGMMWYLSAQTEIFPQTDSLGKDMLAVAAHFAEYAVLAALLWVALARTTARPRAMLLAVTFYASASYAVLDELHQAFVPGRTPDMVDIAVDLAGILTAIWLLRRFTR